MELGDWVKGIEKIFTLVEISKEKKVNITVFYLTGEADIWWNTVQGRFVNFT